MTIDCYFSQPDTTFREVSNGKKELTLQLSKKICEMIEDGKTAEESRKSCDVQANTFRHWITNAVLLPTEGTDMPLLKLRTALIERLLKGTVVLGMLKAASETSKYKSYKTTILSELSKSEKALLEQQGYESFIKQVENGAIILKVEETITGIAPDPSLFKEILKAIDTGDVETTQKLTPFSPPHPSCP